MVNFRAPFAGCLLSLAASAAVAAPFAQLSSADQQLAAANHPAAVMMIASKTRRRAGRAEHHLHGLQAELTASGQAGAPGRGRVPIWLDQVDRSGQSAYMRGLAHGRHL
jgi:hypothetical protein